MSHARAATLLLAALLPATLGGCTLLQGHWMAHRVASGLHAIEHYRARTVERGIVREDPRVPVVRDVIYERLWRVRAEVLEPEDHRGQLFIFDGQAYTLWWPRFFFGMRIRGVRVPPRNEVGDAILESCLWTLRHYELDEGDEAEVAGRPVRTWTCTPRRAQDGLPPYRASTDERYDVPLELSVGDPAADPPWYAFRFAALDLQARPPADAFRFEFPEGATVYEWDLQAPPVTLDEAQARAEFPVLVPARLPRGHALEKIVLSRHEDMYMVALLYPKRGRWLSLTEVPNMGPILVPELGIDVRVGDAPGVMNFAFGFTVLSWSVGTTSLTLVGNLPWPEMLDVAASVGPPESHPVGPVTRGG